MDSQKKKKINTVADKTKTAKQIKKLEILEKLEIWFELHSKKIFYVLIILSTLFSLLLFDSKVSDGGDDSSYIERAWSFLNGGNFPYFQGPAYPVALSFFVKLFGLNLIALKFFSVICQFGFVWITYLTFRKRLPYLVLFALLSFISFNNFIQYYASQTFTETFFLFVQSICLYITFNIIDTINNELDLKEDIRKNYKKWLLFGLLFVILSISKSVAFIAIVGVLIYFAFNKNYKQILYAILVYTIFKIMYYLITTTAFGANTTNQLEMMLRKDLYKPQGAHEDFSGMIDRFFDNFNTYISLHIYRIMNLRSFEYDTSKIIPALSYLSTVLLGIVTFFSYKKNKFVFFSSIYLITLCVGVFFGVQANNMQDRLIIIVMPLIFLVMFYGIYEFAKRFSGLQSILLIIVIIMLIRTIGISAINAKQNMSTLKKNISGDIYYGFTPDWINFLKMSKYCADSLPDSSKVLSRKPSMSFIYGNGKKFIGQWDSPSNPNADSVLANWKKQNVNYVILANLRMQPKKNNGRVINNIHRMLQPIAEKYPQKIKLVKSIGDDEKCELYKIVY